MNKMGIKYERKMKLEYDLDVWRKYPQIVEELHNKGISLISKYNISEPDDEDYGKRTIESSKETHWIIINDIKAWSSTETQLTNLQQSLKETMKELKVEIVTETKNTKKYDWSPLKGSLVYCTFNGIQGKQKDQVLNYANQVSMKINIIKLYTTLVLEFTITWEANRVQRGTKIEDMLVNQPLSDMGQIQNILESVLENTYKFTREPIIDCKFNAITESTSECAPDIIARVRNARKGSEEE
jgi:hypothetical protein